MKRASFVFAGIAALCFAFSAGCGSKPTSGMSNLKDADGKAWKPMGQAMASSPEIKMTHLATPQDRANYLKSLATDKNFNPKDHVPMLEAQAKDADPDVASAAKELLDKAK